MYCCGFNRHVCRGKKPLYNSQQSFSAVHSISCVYSVSCLGHSPQNPLHIHKNEPTNVDACTLHIFTVYLPVILNRHSIWLTYIIVLIYGIMCSTCVLYVHVKLLLLILFIFLSAHTNVGCWSSINLTITY